MKLGLEVFLEKHAALYRGKKIGLLTNVTGVNKQLVSSIDLFYEHKEINLTTLFSPEHGLRGDVKEGKWIDSTIDPYTRLPVFSLYNKEKKPNTEMLANVDVVFCDLQDIGSRYYTFIYSIANMLKVCRAQGKQVVVLDRPNPINGLEVEGNIVQDGFTSFVGEYPVAMRHGLTIGEIITLFNEEYAIHCDLKVIQMEGWRRERYFDETELLWVSPTPNTTNVEMCLLYPGTCLIEGTNLSEGRGTTKPFEIVGAPFMNGHKLAKEMNSRNLTGVIFRPTTFRPSISKFAGELCEGVQIHIIDRKNVRPVLIGVTLLSVIFTLYPRQASFIRSSDFNNRYFLDLLAGTDELRKQLLMNDIQPFIDRIKQDQETFEKTRNKYLFYS
ncbi:exo-beta-N-acetylmuramidase NamZ family protein [Pseudogracilibacillus auburnensis]|uniref:exo-beta-N-acetylmuramidase NamZ family protein n=1 Tax=Pseudogracilibacillus auburnensis TaxID=1494959 RepID=UPI001A9567E4|nr:DUF1343 domain-containing protein [Pseudogracilibacillus auburnensis]MBO1004665.1 DUF1343 domain-containing protein [Pseudogracilibacillus auburnensis]